MKNLCLCLFIQVLFSLCVQAEVNPAWKKYPYHQIGSDIYFPKDEGKHTMFPNLEWWYTVIHAKGEITGDRYSILVTHFNNRFRFFTVTNIDRERHYSGTTTGKLVSQKGYLDLKHKTKYGVDIFKSKKDDDGKLIPFEYEIKTLHDKMVLDVSLSAIKRPLMIGETGYTPVGSSGHSWYYSLTRLEALGNLSIDGFTEKIKGLAWMDHQWGPFIVSPVQFGKTFESYEWFCIQLDDGSDIMISNIYNRKFEIPMTKAYGRVEFSDKNGNSKSSIQRTFKRTRYWQDPVSGHYMSMGWSLSIPKWNLNIDMTPDFTGQMVRFPFNGDFWEGSIKVSGQINGKVVKGKAFGELIHRFQKPILKIKRPKIDYKKRQLKISWKVKNPDAGNPLTYDLSILGEQGVTVVFKNLKDTKLTLPFKNLMLNKLEPFKIQVDGHSVDKVLRGQTKTREITL